MAITRAKKNPGVAVSRTGAVGQRAEEFIDKAEAVTMASTVTASASKALITAPVPTEREPVDMAASVREQRALALVKSYLPLATVAGLVPVPAFDLAAIIAVQLTMLSSLSKLYGVPFQKEAAKSCVAALMATLLQGTLAWGLISASKMVPVLGSLIGIAALPALGAAGTYAVGKVFITHFEAGGTFLDFDPKKVQAHFKAEFEQAKKKV